ncbi:MAG: hypothetical protein M3412_07445 [Chloroflexota bacterium]|nr:hypothetical protein [Chloroflexota bacterium]
MIKRADISDDERRQASRNIRNFFMFTEDVLEDPRILDLMPDESHVEPIPSEEREPGRRYDLETSRMVVRVTPLTEDKAVPAKSRRKQA